MNQRAPESNVGRSALLPTASPPAAELCSRRPCLEMHDSEQASPPVCNPHVSKGLESGPGVELCWELFELLVRNVCECK